MGLRFRKSINLGGGARVNLSKKGIGYSVGTKGARITKTADGKTRKTVSIPNTGISYTTESGKSKKKVESSAAVASMPPYKALASFLRITSIITFILSLLLVLVLPPVGIIGIILAVIEWILANKYKKQYKSLEIEECI